MAKSFELVRDITLETAREKLPLLQPHYEAHLLESPEEIHEARRLATLTFSALGKIDSAELGEDGVLRHDSFLDRSSFFGTFVDGEMSVTTRLIWTPDGTVEDLRLPTERIDRDKAIFLKEQPPGTVAEIGALAKVRGSSNVATLKLLREVFGFADQNDIRYLVCGLEPKLYPTYNKLFGGALQRLHDEEIEFPGIIGMQVPLMIDLRHSFEHQKDEMHKRTLGDRAIGFFVRNYFRPNVESWH